MKPIILFLSLFLFAACRDRGIEPVEEPLPQTSLTGQWTMFCPTDTATLRYDLTITEFPTWVKAVMSDNQTTFIEFGGHIYDDTFVVQAGQDPEYHTIAAKYSSAKSFLSGTWTTWLHPEVGHWISVRREFCAIKTEYLSSSSFAYYFLSYNKPHRM